MQRIKELIVVEGRHDVERLHKLFDCDVVITNGLSLDDNAMEMIRAASDKQGVVVLTDPDHPGEVIRKAVMEIAPKAKHAFINREDAIGKRNVGVEYANDQAIIDALNSCVVFDNKTESISWQEYCSLDIIGNSENREKVCRHFHTGHCNNKTLFKRLNMLGITSDEVREILE